MRTLHALSRALLLALLALAATASVAPATTLFGIGDESPALFQNTRFTDLSQVRVVRYIAPWDVEKHPDQLAAANEWISTAHDAGYKVLVAFNYSRTTPLKLPTVAQYVKSVKPFVTAHRTDVETWSVFNEANRGLTPGRFNTPGPKLAGQLWAAFRSSVCVGCKTVGLDVLDGNDMAPTLTYVAAFMKAAGGVMPTIWGFHNYSDVNRLSDLRTAAYIKATKTGQVWVTETGGLYRLGRSFPANLARQLIATKQVFKIAKQLPLVKRVYFYNFFAPSGASIDDPFDAGLLGPTGTPRPAYNYLHAQLQ